MEQKELEKYLLSLPKLMSETPLNQNNVYLF